MIVVFPFDGVAFHEAGCGSASLSATETVRKQAAQLILVAYSSSSAPCLLNKRCHLCCCGTEPLHKTRGAANTSDPSLELRLSIDACAGGFFLHCVLSVAGRRALS